METTLSQKLTEQLHDLVEKGLLSRLSSTGAVFQEDRTAQIEFATEEEQVAFFEKEEKTLERQMKKALKANEFSKLAKRSRAASPTLTPGSSQYERTPKSSMGGVSQATPTPNRNRGADTAKMSPKLLFMNRSTTPSAIPFSSPAPQTPKTPSRNANIFDMFNTMRAKTPIGVPGPSRPPSSVSNSAVGPSSVTASAMKKGKDKKEKKAGKSKRRRETSPDSSKGSKGKGKEKAS